MRNAVVFSCRREGGIIPGMRETNIEDIVADLRRRGVRRMSIAVQRGLERRFPQAQADDIIAAMEEAESAALLSGPIISWGDDDPLTERRALNNALRLWIADSLAYQRQTDRWLRVSPDEMAEIERNRRHLTARMARKAHRCFPYATRDNSDLGAERLAEIAEALSPGGVHNGADLYRTLTDFGVEIDSRLRAALIYSNWSGGKIGFQFMPDPAKTPLWLYREEAERLAAALVAGHDGDPRHVLVDEDRSFYAQLPDTFTAYRGLAGVSAAKAAAGPCWTLSRDLAEWFAHRSVHGRRRPIVVSTVVSKAAVLLVNAGEAEIVLPPQTGARRLPLRHAADMERPSVDLVGDRSR
jgi:hypothetical protein